MLYINSTVPFLISHLWCLRCCGDLLTPVYKMCLLGPKLLLVSFNNSGTDTAFVDTVLWYIFWPALHRKEGTLCMQLALRYYCHGLGDTK